MQDAVLQWKRAKLLCLMLFSKISNFDLMVFKGSYSSVAVAVVVVVYVSSRTPDVGDLCFISNLLSRSVTLVYYLCSSGVHNIHEYMTVI